jgi:hypothetical protein
MFNSYHETHQHRSENVKVEKHEHRAPTDESIRIYSEMVEKAEESIVCKLSTGDNAIKANAIIFHNASLGEYHCRFHFTINGIPFDSEVALDKIEVGLSLDGRDAYNRVIARIAESLTHALINYMQPDFHWKWMQMADVPTKPADVIANRSRQP